MLQVVQSGHVTVGIRPNKTLEVRGLDLEGCGGLLDRGRGRERPHGGPRPFHQKSNCLAQLNSGSYVVQSWSRCGRNFDLERGSGLLSGRGSCKCLTDEAPVVLLLNGFVSLARILSCITLMLFCITLTIFCITILGKNWTLRGEAVS